MVIFLSIFKDIYVDKFSEGEKKIPVTYDTWVLSCCADTHQSFNT